MNTKYILDDKGEPLACCDLMQWAAWYENANRRVALDVIHTDRENCYVVSTVFLGLDYGFGFQKGPVVWETIVFKGGAVFMSNRLWGLKGAGISYACGNEKEDAHTEAA